MGGAKALEWFVSRVRQNSPGERFHPVRLDGVSDLLVTILEVTACTVLRPSATLSKRFRREELVDWPLIHVLIFVLTCPREHRRTRPST